MKLLLANRADVNAKSNGGVTPLNIAATKGYDVVELLLANKADVNAKDWAGLTPLHYATDKGYKDVVELLLANRADVNAKSKGGDTPVSIAATKGYKDVVELLLASTARENTDSKSDYWKCPRCGVLLRKGFGALLAGAEVRGLATCGRCGAEFSQSDVYAGKYDVQERAVDDPA